MKKLLLSAAFLLGMAPAFAQVNLYTEVEENVYAMTTVTQDFLDTTFPEWVGEAAWNMGVLLPKDYVMFDNDRLTIKAGIDNTSVFTSGNKFSDMQKDFPTYTAYVNLGSLLADKGWTGDEQILFVDEYAPGKNHSIIVVTPKVDGKLKFGVYAGDNEREIGIYKLDEENLVDYGWVNMYQFKHEDAAPAYVEGDVKAGRNYALMGGGTKNLTMHQITFVPTGGGTGITNVDAQAEKTVEAYYTLDGTRVSTPAKGIYIVKYSDGTAKKVVK